MPLELPAEIWTHIFDLAADEDILFRYGIPTVMAESAWYKDPIINEWRLRSPGEAMNLLQRRSYATKKVRLPEESSDPGRTASNMICLGNHVHLSPVARSGRRVSFPVSALQ